MNKVTAEEYNLVEDRSRNGLPGPLGAEGGCISIGEVLGLYGELGAESLEALANVRQKPVELKRNQKVFSLCEGRADIFVVKEGWASLSHATSTRGQDICNVFMPGDIIGMRESFFESHDIVILSLTHCKLEKVSVDDLHALFKTSDEIRKAITSYVMVNDNITIERLRSCTHHRSEERVAHFLLEVYARFNFKGLLNSNVFSFPVTQDIVGELLGMTSVHVSRCMTALEQKKLIRKTRSSIKLLQPEEMARNTGFDRDFIYGHICLG
ncbi:Crp/Fnr family transcriptional regulator [Halomonas sp. C22]|uniref:Crp/Fnr family transcriptional regulator n=1 Tax=Halomonas sp. C22 TaxID=2580567 RepID=UPI0011A4AE71|nr:Crp/Fnr family transcriptional regulator [Halomonas sp. C22]